MVGCFICWSNSGQDGGVGEEAYFRGRYFEVGYRMNRMKWSFGRGGRWFVAMVCAALLCGACDDYRAGRELACAEKIMETDPDSARVLLENMSARYLMSASTFARRSLLLGRVRDEQQKICWATNPLTTRQWLKAQAYLDRRGTPQEQAQIRLYTGRSQTDDGDYAAATDTYKKALLLATQIGDYALAGYLSSYLADLYRDRDLNELAIKKYLEAADFHKRTGNARSQALALRDIVYCYLGEGKMELALTTLRSADSIMRPTGDSIAIRALKSDYGVVYSDMKQYDLAEKYLLKNINPDDPWPTYIALSEVYINKKDFAKAREYAAKAETPKNYWSVCRLYYLIGKAEGNMEQALHYFELYHQAVDSIDTRQNRVNVYEVERRYDKSLLEGENMRLQVAILYRTLAVVGMGIAAAVVLWLLRRSKNRRIRRQREMLREKEQEIRGLMAQLRENENKLSTQREAEAEAYRKQKEQVEMLVKSLKEMKRQMLHETTVGKKIVRTVKQGALSGVRLSARDWETLEQVIRAIYPHAYEFFSERIYAEKSNVYRRLCLLSFFDTDTKVEAYLLDLTDDNAARQWRHRLRKILGMKGTVSIADFLRSRE